MLDENLIANILSLTLFFVSLFIALRAFYLYFQARSRRVFILALSMGMIALTAIAGFAGDNITSINLNVDWFNYIGQTVSFLFILLSFARSADDYQRGLIRWHIIISALLLILLLLAPVLSDFPDPAVTKTVLSGSRSLICAVIFFHYIMAFTTKETRFSLLMAGAFLLLSAGYLVILPKYYSAANTTLNLTLIDHTGDITRVCGLILLFIAVLLG
jgi:hypothetical protein